MEYCSKAYAKGVRCFVVELSVDLPDDACIIQVDHALSALQRLAKSHREQFAIPVIGITGSLGKTTIKEWLYFLLKDAYKVVRTPMSYNSQLGVALALLEMNESHEIAIIEADISHPEEMKRLEEMIAPTLGIFTGIGSHYVENFESPEVHLNEHLFLFQEANFCFIDQVYHSALRRRKIPAIETTVDEWNSYGINELSFPISRALCLKAAQFLGVETDVLKERIQHLPSLSGRREVFEGINGNLIINDSYNIDVDALEQALEYVMGSKERNKKVVVLDLSHVDEGRKNEISALVERFHPDHCFFVEKDTLPSQLLDMHDAVILFKGSFRSNLKNLVQRFKNKKHETWVEFDLKAILTNLRYFQSFSPKGTKTLVMVKASSYGTGDVKIPHFLQENGIDYLGVAYTDEGVTLRDNGIELPILVMNAEENAFDDIILNQLEPAIYSTHQLKSFVSSVERLGQMNYPIHLKLETGMQRLGIDEKELEQLLELLNSSDAVYLKSAYSHLADADNADDQFSRNQLHRFQQYVDRLKKEIRQEDDVLFHILNSEGVLRFGDDASFDMVRLGIGIFGYASKSEQLMPSVRWMTTVSQIKELSAGESVGYGREFKANQPVKIATIRIGYADGFRRSLSNGRGVVFVQGVACKVIGNVCMDMTMIDVTHVNCQPGDEVEIIGPHQTLLEFAQSMSTIPYEVMTGINKRVARVYLQQ